MTNRGNAAIYCRIFVTPKETLLVFNRKKLRAAN